MVWWIVCPLVLLLLMMCIRQPEYTGGGLTVIFFVSGVSGFLILMFAHDGSFSRGIGLAWLIVTGLMTLVYLVGGAVAVVASFTREDAEDRASARKALRAEAEVWQAQRDVSEEADCHPFPSALIQDFAKTGIAFRDSGPFDAVMDSWDTDMLHVIVAVGARAGTQKPLHANLYQKLSTEPMSRNRAENVVTRAWPAHIITFHVPHVIDAAVALALEIPDCIVGTLQFLTFLANLSAQAAADSEASHQQALAEYTAFITEAVRERMSTAEAEEAGRHRSAGVYSDSSTAPYTLLGVDHTATREDVKAAYHRKVREWHPDRLENMAPELRAYANRELARINSAYEELSKNA